MKKAIIFCNLHANGDIIWSRQGVRWVVDQLGDKFVYFYVHTKHKDICFIHEKVNVITIPQSFHGFPMNRVKDQFNLDMFEDALWVDVWAASFEKMQRVDCGEDGVRFKLPDEFGNYHADCEEIQDSPTWQQKLYSEKIGYINEFLATNFSTKRLEVPDSKEFICKWNSNPKHKFFADIFLKRTKKFDLRVMICNGNTTSSQRRNFIYEDILRDYILNNPKICFYLTSKINEIEADNVFYMDDNFPIPNMDEIEYIMKSCDIIVTSQSGPGCLVFADEIVFDENRTLINFCVDRVDWYFDGGTCEYIRTSNFEDENVYNLITQNIEKKLSKK
jgi:hypothetical protein